MQNVFCIKVIWSVPNIECHSVYTTQSEFIPKSESEQVDSELTPKFGALATDLKKLPHRIRKCRK